MARAAQAKTTEPSPDPRGEVIEGEIVESTEHAMAAGAAAGQAGALAGMESSLAVKQSQADLDQLIVTAHKFPRSITRVLENITTLATLDTPTAHECSFSLPRGKDPETGKPKAITGPSIRLAEIIASQWGNCRVGSQVVAVERGDKVVVAEGIFLDLETNYQSTVRVRRKISDSKGRIYSEDMIVVTGNAAAAIALRNAILRGVPKPVWRQAYDKVLGVITGDVATIGARRVDLLSKFKADFKMTPRQVFAIVGVAGEQDIGPEEIVIAAGFYTALRNGEVTPEDLLKDAAASQSPGGKTLGDAYGTKESAPQTTPPAATEQHDPITGEVKETAPAKEDHKLPPAQTTTSPASTTTSAGANQSETVTIETAKISAEASTPQDDPDQARPGEVYVLFGDALDEGGRRATYKDGDQFSTVSEAGAKTLPTRRSHPQGTAASSEAGSITTDPENRVDPEQQEDEPEAEDEDEAIEEAPEFAKFRAAVMGTESWLTIKAEWGALRKSPVYEGAPRDVQVAAQRVAAHATVALIQAKKDPVKIHEDPILYMLWLTIAEPDAIGPMWQDVIQTPAYNKMNDAQRDVLADATNAAAPEDGE